MVFSMYKDERLKQGHISLPIPEELKIKLENSHEAFYLLKGNGPIVLLEQALANDLIADVLSDVYRLTTKSFKGWIKEEGFFKEYPKWLDETLTLIFKRRKIDVTNCKDDMYSSLFICDRLLSKYSYIDSPNRSIDELIVEAEELYFKTANKDYIPLEFSDMSRIFFELGKNKLEYIGDGYLQEVSPKQKTKEKKG